MFWPVRDLAAVPLVSSEPVHRFTWRARQRHRPGLQFMVSTRRHHGFESLEEARLLLALDFVRVAEVLPQLFRLAFEHAKGRAEYIPDLPAVVPDGNRWPFDVRPRKLIGEDDALKFAAAHEAPAASGWRYDIVADWRPSVVSVLDQLSAQRRPLTESLGLREPLGEAADATSFGQLVESTSLPVVAQAQALHLLWHRRIGTGLGRPLTDASPVCISAHARVHGLEPAQTNRRFDPVEPDRFRTTTADETAGFLDHLSGIESNLRLRRAEPEMLTGGGMPEYMMRRPSGVVGVLERLSEDGAQEAMDSGKELLDEIAISLGGPSGDPSTGEIPPIPGKVRPPSLARPAASTRRTPPSTTVDRAPPTPRADR
ncbi:hypothetical protein I3215_01075 [Streptomyces sp. RB110-1]|uniref:hypothetical protein n=1 Tax=unclassified Streptomyces TaxID=2593676 RepID=UPI0019012D2E|nr:MULTISPECIES: hypothetical protein [unclassified Streptomyces]MBK0371506.1 hypothetical protein [Streptomyces sp. RB110-1]MBK0385558.1 hypothetical protein [Streptomyces sp. RB110-2]